MAAAPAPVVPRKTLWEMLGKTGEAYSQPVIELGLTLMANQLTAPQAVSVMRAFLRIEYPEKKEGNDYRIPDASRFREWRRYLEPISHYLAVSVIRIASRTHVMYDATTKNHVHVFQTSFRCEIKTKDGDIIIVDVPLKFEICPSGKADAVAAQMYEAMSSDVAEKPKVSGGFTSTAYLQRTYRTCTGQAVTRLMPRGCFWSCQRRWASREHFHQNPKRHLLTRPVRNMQHLR